jgi:hypothetical protein
VFRTVSLLHESWWKTCRTCTINAQVCEMKLRWNFSQRMQLIHSIGPKTHVLGRFRPFRYCTKVDARLAEQMPLAHKFAKKTRVRIFWNECTRSTPWDPKLIFWGRFGPFRYCTKVDAKQSELAPLMPKSAKRSCVEIFRSERTRSTPLDPKLMFWGVSDSFVTARKSMQNWLNRFHERTS